MQYAKVEYWADNGKWVTKGGAALDPTHVIATEGETFVLDLALCGIEVVPETLHFHMGGHNGSTGSVLITKIAVLNAVETTITYDQVMSNYGEH